MNVRIISTSGNFGGRGKALLSLSSYLSTDFDVTVIQDDCPSFTELTTHHGIYPDVEWMNDGRFFSGDADVIMGFDSETNSLLEDFDIPTIAYCRRGIGNWADEYWTPSKMAADRHNAWLREHDLEDNCYPIYPVWYVQKPNSVRPFNEREYDVLLHDRKAGGIGEHLSDYHIHYASDYKWDELTDVYENSKVFLFPTKTRFEALGLMPIEAAAYGCHLALPRNAGVSEIYPLSVYRRPEKAIPELLSEDRVSDLPIPSSPTDPTERLLRLTRETTTA